MVVLIRDFGNKFCSISVFHTLVSNMTHSSNIDMTSEIVNDILKSACKNYNKVRGHMMTSDIYSPRTTFISSSECDKNLSGAVHTGVEVHRIDSEMSRLVE